MPAERPDSVMTMNTATGKRLLALVRDGDYAHPGEEEANELLFAGVRTDPRRRVLDAGCGSAGTAAWVQARGLGAVTGVERDAATAQLARERHPEVTVVQGDLRHATAVLLGPFDLAYSMTALYAVPDQPAAFEQLALLAAPGADLRLLEYSDPHGGFAAATRDSVSWAWWRPLDPLPLSAILEAAGWSDIKVRDLHPEFVRWYVLLCRRMATRRGEIVTEFGREWYDSATREYAGILELVRSKALGGVLVTARKR